MKSEAAPLLWTAPVSCRTLPLMRANIVLAALALSLWAGTLCVVHADPRKMIKIGAILPLTGDMAAVGAACRDAALLAIEDGAALSKYRYELVIEDDRLTPAMVATAAQKLIAVNRVAAIVSTWSYGGRIVAPLAEREQIPHLGIAWDVRVADGEYNFVHLTPPDEFMRLFLDVFKKLGVRRVALLGVEESGSVYAFDEFTRMAPAYGVEVVFRDAVLWDLNDFNSLTARIGKSKPDYLLFNLGGQGLNTRLLQSLKAQQVTFRYTAVTSFDVLENTALIEGRWYVSDSFLPEEFAVRFRERYGHALRYGVGNFYEAVRLLVYSFEHAPAPTPPAARGVLAGIRDLPSIFGPTSADPAGVFTYPAQYVRVVRGKREKITIDEIFE